LLPFVLGFYYNRISLAEHFLEELKFVRQKRHLPFTRFAPFMINFISVICQKPGMSDVDYVETIKADLLAISVSNHHF